MRKLLSISFVTISLLLVPAVAFPSAVSAALWSGSVATTPDPTTEPPITLAGDKSLSECISAAPKPDCRTSDGADAKQLALLGILVAAMGFLGWKISSGVRARNRGAEPSART